MISHQVPRSPGPREVLIALAGYLGPNAFGLWAAKLIETGHVIAVLWIAAIFLVLLLFLIRKSFGVISVPAAIARLALVMRYAHSGLEEIVSYAMTWLPLLSGARNAVSHGGGGRRGAQRDHPAAPPVLGPAVDRGHAPSRGHRGQMADLAILMPGDHKNLRDQAGTGVMPEVEIRKPLPPTTQVMPVVADAQRNGPALAAVP